MSGKDTGGQAFPIAGGSERHSDGGSCWLPQSGMTLRDYFAARAMNGYISQVENSLAISEGKTSAKSVCGACYEWADAMIKARSAA